MGKYRFGLHTGEVSEYLFGLHDNHLTAVADQIAARHGAWHVNYKESCGERRGWFACPNLGPAFYQVIARAVMADVDRAGGIKALYRDELDSAADERCGGMPTFQRRCQNLKDHSNALMNIPTVCGPTQPRWTMFRGELAVLRGKLHVSRWSQRAHAGDTASLTCIR